MAGGGENAENDPRGLSMRDSALSLSESGGAGERGGSTRASPSPAALPHSASSAGREKTVRQAPVKPFLPSASPLNVAVTFYWPSRRGETGTESEEDNQEFRVTVGVMRRESFPSSSSTLKAASAATAVRERETGEKGGVGATAVGGGIGGDRERGEIEWRHSWRCFSEFVALEEALDVLLGKTVALPRIKRHQTRSILGKTLPSLSLSLIRGKAFLQRRQSELSAYLKVLASLHEVGRLPLFRMFCGVRSNEVWLSDSAAQYEKGYTRKGLARTNVGDPDRPLSKPKDAISYDLLRYDSPSTSPFSPARLALEKSLLSRGLKGVGMPADGSCFLHCLVWELHALGLVPSSSDTLEKTVSLKEDGTGKRRVYAALSLRKLLSEYIRLHKLPLASKLLMTPEDVEERAKIFAKEKESASLLELYAAASMFKLNISVIASDDNFQVDTIRRVIGTTPISTGPVANIILGYVVPEKKGKPGHYICTRPLFSYTYNVMDSNIAWF